MIKNSPFFKIVGGTLALTCLATTQSPSAEATTFELEVHIGSHHFNERPGPQEWQERNPGLGVKVENGGEVLYGAGAYRNSLDDLTAYAGAARRWERGIPYTGRQTGVTVGDGVITSYQGGPKLAPLLQVHAGPVVVTPIPWPEPTIAIGIREAF